jgi:hypothetical protein
LGYGPAYGGRKSHVVPKKKVINDASNPGHCFWCIYTRMNWGEPWHARFRESQTEYRLKNQDCFRRSVMPCMLGWFNMTRQTRREDVEWLLARAAGFDAGFALNTSFGCRFHSAGNPEVQLEFRTIGEAETLVIGGGACQ